MAVGSRDVEAIAGEGEVGRVLGEVVDKVGATGFESGRGGSAEAMASRGGDGTIGAGVEGALSSMADCLSGEGARGW
jgi:hypothetical protein